MSQDDTDTIQKSEKNLVSKLLAFIGICCLLQFFIVGPLGIIHSNNAEKVSDVIFIVGVLFILPYYPRQKRPFICIFLLMFMTMCTMLLDFDSGHHVKKGSEYYNQGQYQEALQSFKKQTQTWYLRLRYNHHESETMEMMAKTYCQLEDFDSARDTYKLMIDRYSGDFRVDWYQKRLKKLKKGLEIVANYPEQVPETKGSLEDLYNIARTYQYDLNCHTKALEVYTKILGMDIPVKLKLEVYAKILGMDIPEELKTLAKESILQSSVK